MARHGTLIYQSNVEGVSVETDWDRSENFLRERGAGGLSASLAFLHPEKPMKEREKRKKRKNGRAVGSIGQIKHFSRSLAIS